MEAVVAVAFNNDSGVVDRGADSDERFDGRDDCVGDTGECGKGGKMGRIIRVQGFFCAVSG